MKDIKLETTDKHLSSYGGLFLVRTLLDELHLDHRVAEYLPKTPKKNLDTADKFEALLLGFILGNNHLDDWDESNKDAAIQAVQERTFGAKCLGDYLRSFSVNL